MSYFVVVLTRVLYFYRLIHYVACAVYLHVFLLYFILRSQYSQGTVIGASIVKYVNSYYLHDAMLTWY